MRINGGKSYYGAAVGILLLDGIIPRLPGDIGNALTFPFPVVYKVVRGVDFHALRQGLSDEALGRFIAVAREFEQEGVRTITTSCGCLGAYQKELAAAVEIPVFTSSLIQAPLIQTMLGPNKKIGLLTSEVGPLFPKMLAGVGATDVPMVIEGLDGSPSFAAMHSDDPHVNPEILCSEVLAAAEKLAADADVGAIILECTNLSPYAVAVQDKTGLPVFDIISLVHYVHYATVQKPYPLPRRL